MSKKIKDHTLEELLEEALVHEDEQPYKIPENWLWVKNKTISTCIRGLSYKKSDVKLNEADTLLVLRGGNIQEDELVDQSDNVYVSSSLVSEVKLLRENDIVLVSSTGSSKVIGKAASVSKDFVNQTFGAFLTTIRPSDFIESAFLGMYFKSNYYRNTISLLAKGSNINNIKNEHLENLFIPIPPLKEQKRIVIRVEKLLFKIEEARKLVKEAKETFELRRAAILNEVFQKNEIEHINSEKDSELIEPYKLSNGWKWLKLSEVGELNRGKSKHRPRNDSKLFGGNYPFIQTGDVAKAGKYVTSYKQTLSEFGLLQSRMFNKGTLCITIAANIADTALLGFDSCFPDSVVGFNTKHNYISNEYVHYYITTIKEELEHYAPATAQKNINLKVLNEVLVPIPPEEEYLKIIHFLPKLEKIENEISNNLDLERTLETLKSSILSKAFRGKLGTYNSNDENARELLNSVLQEKLN